MTLNPADMREFRLDAQAAITPVDGICPWCGGPLYSRTVIDGLNEDRIRLLNALQSVKNDDATNDLTPK